MSSEADFVGLTDEQARRFRDIDDEIAQTQAGIAVWHRLLDRRRLDRKQGLHPITEFAADQTPAGDEQGTLVKKPTATIEASPREPFYVHSETEGRALLIRCIGYLGDAAGEKFAFDKGYGERDKVAEWIRQEIKQLGAIAYIRKHSPYIFGIPIAVSDT